MRMIDWRVMAVLAVAACSPAAEEQQAPAADNAVRTANAATPVEAAPTAPTRQSVFTRLDPATCRLIEENREEGPYWLRRCPGHAGWQLDWGESDLRQGLTLIAPGGREMELRLSDLVANGAFNSLGETIEWRGRDSNRPEVLIVRMNVAHGVEAELPEISRLAVIRLAAPACLVAVVPPGPGQNEKARQVADGPLPDCITD